MSLKNNFNFLNLFLKNSSNFFKPNTSPWTLKYSRNIRPDTSSLVMFCSLRYYKKKLEILIFYLSKICRPNSVLDMLSNKKKRFLSIFSLIYRRTKKLNVDLFFKIQNTKMSSKSFINIANSFFQHLTCQQKFPCNFFQNQIT